MNKTISLACAAASIAFSAMTPLPAATQQTDTQLYECVTTTTTTTRYSKEADGTTVTTTVVVSQKVCTPISG